MVCCAALNCSNRSDKGWKLFKLPRGDRGKIWVQNIRRGNEFNSKTAHLCEVVHISIDY